MIGPGEIVSQRFRTVSSQKHGSCVPDSVQIIKGLIQTKFQMLRGDLVCDIQSGSDIRRDNDLSVLVNRSAGDIKACQIFDLNFDLRLDRFCKLHGIRHQNGAGKFVMLRLRQ